MEGEDVAKRLEGRIALITGAGRGIGRAIAIRYAQEGADLFLCATRMETLKETQALASKYGQKIELYTVDVAEREAALWKEAWNKGNMDSANTFVGEATGLINDVLPAEEILSDIVNQAQKRLRAY